LAKEVEEEEYGGVSVGRESEDVRRWLLLEEFEDEECHLVLSLGSRDDGC